MSYIPQDVLDECREALRQGRTLDDLAGQLRVDPAHLANLLGIPQWRAVPTDDDVQDGDLWSVDRLDGVL